MSATDQTIELDDVTICYGAIPAVHHVSCRLPGGTLIALMGPNGAGKSTLMRAMLGWHRLATGRITIAGTSISRCRSRITYLPQRSSIDWDFPLTVRDVVAMGRYQCRGAFARLNASDREQIDQAIADLGLDALQDRHIAALSGGQQQRTLLARAVAGGADIFLLDEPFTGLDPSATIDLAHRLLAWSRMGRSVISVVHDIPLARRFFPYALLVRTHLIAAGPVLTALDDQHVRQAYGDGLQAADDHHPGPATTAPESVPVLPPSHA